MITVQTNRVVMFYDRSDGRGMDPGDDDGNAEVDDFWLDDSAENMDEMAEDAGAAGEGYYDPENQSERVRERSTERGAAYEIAQGYELAVIESVWEFAEAVAGNDAALWRKDEFGDWIYRFDYGKKSAEFGWEIFDPGIGRHNQGVYAMRPMQSGNFLRQYSALG